MHDAKTKDRSKVYGMMRDNRIRYFAEADYREGSELDNLVAIIDRTAGNESLEGFHYKKRECERSED